MTDYTKGKIYAIRSISHPEAVYIGSTVNSLSKRLYCHKSMFNCYANKKRYITSFEVIKYPDCFIELVENYPCKDKNELTRREGEIIRATKCVNRVIPHRDVAEYRACNREKIALCKKTHYDLNWHKIADRRRKYYRDNSERLKLEKSVKVLCKYCETSTTKSHLSRHCSSARHIKNFINY